MVLGPAGDPSQPEALAGWRAVFPLTTPFLTRTLETCSLCVREKMEMLLTTRQVAEKLGVSSPIVLRLRREGHIAAHNTPQDGAKRFFPRFDSKVVAEYVKAGAPGVNGHGHFKVSIAVPHVTIPTTIAGPQGVVSLLAEIAARLERVEAKVNTLTEIWR